MSHLIEKYRAVQVHKDPARTEELQLTLGRMSRAELDLLYTGSREGGTAFLQHSAGDPACVLETVVSNEGGDSVGCLYVGIPLFAERAQYIAAREELVAFLNDVSTDKLVRCQARGRFVPAKDLSLAQLIDVSKYLLDRFNEKRH